MKAFFVTVFKACIFRVAIVKFYFHDAIRWVSIQKDIPPDNALAGWADRNFILLPFFVH